MERQGDEGDYRSCVDGLRGLAEHACDVVVVAVVVGEAAVGVARVVGVHCAAVRPVGSAGLGVVVVVVAAGGIGIGRAAIGSVAIGDLSVVVTIVVRIVLGIISVDRAAVGAVGRADLTVVNVVATDVAVVVRDFTVTLIVIVVDNIVSIVIIVIRCPCQHCCHSMRKL